MTSPLSGARYDLSLGDYAASIASVGASLRTLTFQGRDLVVPFEADGIRPVFRGATLAPWPNRIVGGVYSFGGADHELALTEPERGNALHGLVGWTSFALVTRGDDFVVLGTTIEAQVGYPFRLDLEVEYRLTDAGLYQSVTATNTGVDAAPFGTGPHPYLVAGVGSVDDWTLHLPAELVLTVTPDTLAPIVTVSVDDTDFDFRSPHVIGDTFIDHAFTGITAPRVEVTAPSGTGVALEWDAACPWVQVHTADRPAPEPSRRGLAVEPMTCPPDAFNSGTDLIVIEPGASASAGWTISAL